MILRRIFALLLKDPVRRPLASVLNRMPARKQMLIKIYLKKIAGVESSDPNGDLNLAIFQDTDDVAASYTKLMEITLERNRFNPLHTPGINRIIAALKSNDIEGAGRLSPGETPTDLICACYLFTLRRYPGPNEIATWKGSMEKGIAVRTLLETLMSLSEFHLTGTCTLDNGQA